MKRLIALVLAVFLLSGCQLASEEARSADRNDTLVGVFITFEYLYGGDVLDGSGKIPVTMGEDCWVVDGYEGLSMSHYWNGEYWTSFATEGLCEVHSRLNSTDNGDSIEEEATIYVPMDAEVMCHANPVYQTATGEYYTVSAMGLGGSVSTGGMSQSISDERTWTMDGEETRNSAKFTVAIEGVELAQTVAVVQMSESNQELTRSKYVPGQMPETMTPEPETAYLIVEESGAGETVRSLYQPGDDYVTVYYKGEELWCLPDMMEINWEN